MNSEDSEDKEPLDKQKTDKWDGLRRKSLDSALEIEEILKDILNNSQLVFILRKNEDRLPVEFASENISNFGYTTEDFTSGRVTYKDVIYPDDLEKVEKEFEEKIRNEDHELDIEYRVLTKNGEVCWVSERVSIQKNENGEVKRLLGIVLDITARKKNEERLEKVLERQKVLNTVINNSQVVIFLWRNEKYWPSVFVSDNVIQFGYTVEDFVSKKVLFRLNTPLACCGDGKLPQ